MIAQLLDRRVVLEQMERVQQALKEIRDGGRRSAVPGVEISPEQAAKAVEELEEAKSEELTATSGQQGYNLPGGERRGAPDRSIDEEVFLSHDPVISNLQSAIESCVREQNPGLFSAGRSVNNGRRDGGGGGEDALVTDVSLLPDSEERGDARRLLGPFEQTDPGWIGSLFAEGVRKFRGKRPFNEEPAAPVQIANNARLVLVGDWGSGLPRAQKVSAQMRRVLEQGMRAGLNQHVIHLGDVYYSGWEYEYQARFLDYWPVEPGEERSVFSWSLNGNHDMYSGGWAYYDTLLANRLFKRQQRSSFFSLFNDNWQVFGLDTAHDDAGLKEPQSDWLKSALMAERGKGSMLLSHHQPFGVYEGASKVLAAKMARVLKEAGDVDCWFWGHEHRCVFYREHAGVRNGRLIGHGGVPVYMTHGVHDPYPLPAFYEQRSYLSKMFGLERFAMFGFAVVDFRGREAYVRYVDENGSLHADEVIKAGPPGLPPRDSGLRHKGARAVGEHGGAARAPKSSRRGDEERTFSRALPSEGVVDYFMEPAVPDTAAVVDAARSAKSVGAAVSKPPEVIRRTPHMDLSTGEPVEPGEKFTVSVYADQEAERKGESSSAIEIPRIKGISEYTLQVWLSVSEHFVVLDQSPVKDMTVRVDRPRTDDLVFQVRAVEAFPASNDVSICAIFDYQGRSSGSVRRAVPLARAGTAARPGIPSEAGGDDAGASASVEPEKTLPPTLRVEVGATPPDLTVKVSNPAKDLHTFDCFVRTPHLEEFRNGKPERWQTITQTSAILDKYYGKFTKKVGNNQRRNGMVGAGMELFEAAPALFKKAFWALLDRGKPLRTISVVSDEPYMPWELMVPWRRCELGEEIPRDLPLGAEFCVGRWLSDDYLLPLQGVQLRDSLLFAPTYAGSSLALAHSAAEVTLVSKAFGPKRTVTPATYDALEAELTKRGATIVHFVCHGAASERELQTIYVENKLTMDSADIRGMRRCAEAFQKTKPLVFLNACEVGRPEAGLNGVGGFAKSFIAAGASCVIAPLWSVKDSCAHEVAKVFYGALGGGQPEPFAKILSGIRKRAYEGPEAGEDTYAAYIFYGDPAAVRK